MRVLHPGGVGQVDVMGDAAVEAFDEVRQASFVAALHVRRLAELVETRAGFLYALTGDYGHAGSPVGPSPGAV